MVDVLAFDLGASSGRALVGRFDEHKGALSVQETHRFPNDPVRVHGRIYWDILRLFHEIKESLVAARLQQHTDVQSMGIDTWGVDFGFIGSHGELLGNAYHYRDPYSQGMMEHVLQLVSRDELFHRTGIQFVPINTLYQLFALKQAHSPLLDQAETFLMIPELLRYFLTGERRSEWTIDSTSQLCNPHTHRWERELLTRLGLPEHIFLDPVEPGTFAGSLLPSLSEELGVPSIPVVAVAEHDTASAVVSVPTEGQQFAYLSSGTWSLLGTETSEPVINEQAQALNITNEGGISGTTRLLKNVTGLWLIQECRRAWKNEGKHISYAQESEVLQQAPPFRSFIDPDDPMFLNPTHMPRAIQQSCRESGQSVPESEGEILRCIVESLALRYRFVLEGIESLTQQRFTGLHVVGGGSRHSILCQYTANALARPVWAGPQEATAIGNVLAQLMALGRINNLQQARQIVRASFPLETYEPVNTEAWEEAYQRFCALQTTS